MNPDARPKDDDTRARLALSPMLFSKLLKLNTTISKQKELLNGCNSENGQPPMVHVPKADGTTCSCGDCAVTVNPQLHVPQYPIPLPEDVFLKLRVGQRFTTLDLKSAHQQLPLDPES